jgi:hypothetical protein
MLLVIFWWGARHQLYALGAGNIEHTSILVKPLALLDVPQLLVEWDNINLTSALVSPTHLLSFSFSPTSSSSLVSKSMK